jgi:Ca-activated chloride channel family protein
VLALLAAMSAWTAAPTDQVSVTGRVTDAQTGDPITSAQVFVESLNIGSLTDRDGRYTLLVPDNSITSGLEVTVERIGYARAVERVDATRLVDGRITLDFQLAQEALRLEEVIITGQAGGTQRRALGNAIGQLSTAGNGRDSDDRSRVAPRPTVGPEPVRHYAPAPDRRPTHYRGTPYNREQYDRFADNDFQSVHDHPLSTFSIDVDRASYSNVRRFLLGEHRAPPPEAVQVEEMINYFSYDYAMPEGDDPVGITTELGVAPWDHDHQLLRIGLATRPVVTEDLPPSNLVFLLDVSGSMRSSDKLPLVKQSLRILVEQLRSEDRVAIVVYAGGAGLVLESTPGSRKGRILSAIDRLQAGGSTAGGAGLRLAYRVARENFMPEGNNRVILATDGDFNVGESSDAAMVRLIEERRDQGTFLTVLGFGTGNLQSAKMQSIAQNGNGNYAYIDGLSEARKVFVGEMGGTLLTVAQDVKIQVEFNPINVAAYRLVGYENRLLADEDFNDDRKDAGDIGAGHRVTALYEIVPTRGASHGGRIDPLRYQDRREVVAGPRSEELGFVRLRYKQPRGSESRLMERPVSVEMDDPSDDFQFASAVAGFGMLLRHSEHAGSMTVRRVLALAEDGLGADLDGYRGEFVELVRAYDRLSYHHRRQ